MWEIILGIPLLGMAAILQIGVFGQIRLLNGAVDLIMLNIIAWSINDRTRYSWILMLFGGLLMSYISAMPMNGYMWMYAGIWAMIQFIKKRVWQMPMILMLFATIIGTIIISAGTLGLLYIQNASVDYLAAFQQIVIPSLGMNLLLAIPIYALLNDIANSIYPEEESD